ncbi:MAG: LysR family transcriptional regulator [Gammaproteobacteria bacterium]|nr:LysR family transcriptional regulator [Gammaproteobacteria bacterium]
MRLRQIEVFHAVYSSGTMTNAAAKLNVSQPSVSKVLAHAEQQLGYRLFDRVKGKLIPTPEAHQLFKHVRDVYEDVDRLRHVAKNLKATSAGRIRVASTPAFGLEILPSAIASFRRQYPDAIFEIETLHLDEIHHALLESRIDIGLAFDPSKHPGIRRKRLARARFVVLAPDAATFKGKTSLTIDDFKDRPFVGLNSRGPLGQRLSEFLESSDVQPSFVAWTETYHIAKALVASGAGITIADEITARSAIGGNVVQLPLEPPIKFDITLLQMSDSPLSLVTKKFTKHLGEHVEEILATP